MSRPSSPGRVAGWLSRSLADVPTADDWLSARERAVFDSLRNERRRADWRLGRWAAKAALAASLRVSIGELEIVASSTGAPAAFYGGAPLGAALSLSHRNGRALAVVAEAGVAIGCDLETVEPRSGAFVRTWLAPAERIEVLSISGDVDARLANLIWSAKEASTKLRGEGLRLDVREAVVSLESNQPSDGDWRPLNVAWEREAVTARGWWREEPGWVFAYVSKPTTPAPVAL